MGPDHFSILLLTLQKVESIVYFKKFILLTFYLPFT